MENQSESVVQPPDEKLDELASRLEVAKFIKSIIDCPEPLRKSLKCESEEAYAAVISGIKGFLKQYMDGILDGPPEEEGAEESEESIFSDEEVLILKAYCLKQKSNPKVQQIMGKPVQPKPSTPQTQTEKQKPLPPVRGGKRGRIVDVTEAVGLTGDEAVDSGSEIVALAKHSVEGYWQVALASNPRVRFVMGEDNIEWADDK